MEMAEFVRQGLDGFNRGELGPVEAALAPDVNWFAVEPDQGACRNRDEVLRRLGELVDQGEKFELDELVQAGDRLAVASRDTDGSHWWWLFTVRDGKVVRMDDQPDRETALPAVGDD
jgi:ketosteroid isomerase-like protein